MWKKYVTQSLKYCCKLAKGRSASRVWKCTEAYILESVLPKRHHKETNRYIYPDVGLAQPAIGALLNDRAYLYELTKARKRSLGN